MNDKERKENHVFTLINFRCVQGNCRYRKKN